MCDLGTPVGVQPVDDRQGLCEDSGLWSRKVVWLATQAYDAQGKMACIGMGRPLYTEKADINSILGSGDRKLMF